MEIAAFWDSQTKNGEWCATGSIDLPEGASITLEPGAKLGIFPNENRSSDRAPSFRLVVLRPNKGEQEAGEQSQASARSFRNSSPPADRDPRDRGGQSYQRRTPEPGGDETGDPFDEDETRGATARRLPPPRRAPNTNF